MEIPSDVIERISRKIEEKGACVERERVVSKLNLLVQEFCIPVDEAERTVTNELMREYGLNSPVQSSGPSEVKPLGDVTVNEWVTVEGKIVSLIPTPSESIAQKGVIDDGTGALSFVVWKKANAPVMEERKWYRIESAVVDEFRGSPSLKVHSGTKIKPIDEDRPLIPAITKLEDVKPGIVSVRVKMMQDWEPRHDRMFQTGLVGDETGMIKFVTWKNEQETERLEPDKVYTLYYAGVDEYQGKFSLDLSGAMIMREDGADLEVATGDVTITGALVHVNSRSGVIKRCSVEGCNRVLDRQNWCQIHEHQEKFTYDLRVSAVLDDGEKARNLLIQREMTEKLTGITLDEAILTAENNPLGYDDVLLQIQKALLGRYFTFSGSDMDSALLVKEGSFCTFDAGKHADLLNESAPLPAEVPSEGGDTE